jgi:class 3 adenylate cyclase
VPIQLGRYLAEHIPGAKLVELPGADASLQWETPDLVLDALQEFLTGVGRIAEPTRVLATVLFTTSSPPPSRLPGWVTDAGVSCWTCTTSWPAGWSSRRAARFVKTTGDGVLATFDGPGRAIRCAVALSEELRGLGVNTRAGLRTGEVELRNGDVSGIGVHIAARVLAAADPGEILVSRTVRDLLVGSDVTLDDRGTHPLKGR